LSFIEINYSWYNIGIISYLIIYIYFIHANVRSDTKRVNANWIDCTYMIAQQKQPAAGDTCNVCISLSTSYLLNNDFNYNIFILNKLEMEYFIKKNMFSF